METSERREKMARLLLSSSEPITGSSLAQRFGVTRQVIVQDIAVLRAQGLKVLSTPRGYTVLRDEQRGITRLVAVKHDRSLTACELYAMVDMGIEVVDVIVDHPIYGQITGQLSISTRQDVDQFIQTMDDTGAGLLSSLTDGIHLHTVRGRDKTHLDRLIEKLRQLGFLLEE